MDGAKTRPGRSRRRISRKTFLGLGAVGSMGFLIGCGAEQTQGGSEADSLYFGRVPAAFPLLARVQLDQRPQRPRLLRRRVPHVLLGCVW